MSKNVNRRDSKKLDGRSKKGLDLFNQNYKSVDSGYADIQLNRTREDPSSAILHAQANSYRTDKPIVMQLKQIIQEKETSQSRCSALGVNHLLVA